MISPLKDAWSRRGKSESRVFRSTRSTDSHKVSVDKQDAKKKNMERPIYTCQEGPFCQLQTLTGELVSGKLKCEWSPPEQEILDGKSQKIQ